MAELTDIPKQNEWVAYRNSITGMKDADNTPIWNVGQLNQAIGPTVDGRTWAELHEAMRQFCASAPRA